MQSEIFVTPLLSVQTLPYPLWSLLTFPEHIRILEFELTNIPWLFPTILLTTIQSHLNSAVLLDAEIITILNDEKIKIIVLRNKSNDHRLRHHYHP
jgi:hypothetical protein